MAQHACYTLHCIAVQIIQIWVKFFLLIGHFHYVWLLNNTSIACMRPTRSHINRKSNPNHFGVSFLFNLPIPQLIECFYIVYNSVEIATVSINLRDFSHDLWVILLPSPFILCLPLSSIFCFVVFGFASLPLIEGEIWLMRKWAHFHYTFSKALYLLTCALCLLTVRNLMFVGWELFLCQVKIA